MHRCTVKWFDAVKGIGFIARERDGNDVAVASAGTQCPDVNTPQPPPKPRKPRTRKKSPGA